MEIVTLFDVVHQAQFGCEQTRFRIDGGKCVAIHIFEIGFRKYVWCGGAGVNAIAEKVCVADDLVTDKSVDREVVHRFDIESDVKIERCIVV